MQRSVITDEDFALGDNDVEGVRLNNEVAHTTYPLLTLPPADDKTEDVAMFGLLHLTPKAKARVTKILEGYCDSTLSDEDAANAFEQELLDYKLKLGRPDKLSFTFFGSDPEYIYKTVHTKTQAVREQLKQKGVRDSENIKFVFKFTDDDRASLQNATTLFSRNTDLLPVNTTVKLIEDQTLFLRHKR